MPVTPASQPTVLREKERVIAPPRSAVPAPGAGPVFGRGFFRLFSESGIGWFFLVFLAVGSALFLFGLAGTIGPYKEGLRENGDPRFFLGAMAFGTVFCLVTLRMMQVALTETANRPGRKGSKAEPWTWDYPWREDWMPPDYSGGGSGTVLGRVAFLALLGLFNVVWASPSWLLKGIVAFFDLFGLLIVYDSFQKLYQWLRFRRPVVIWETLPAFLGGQLRGRVAFARGVRAAGPPRLTLRCVRDEWVASGSGKHRTKNLEPQAIYRQTIEVPLAGPPGEPLDAVDFAFEVPPDLPGTDLSLSEAVYWQVLVNVPLPGPNFETVFLAPVYRRS
jgi:hypothetical protein